MTANFCVPLVTVVRNRDLWEEPVAVPAGNIALTATILGINIVLVGIYDVADYQSVALCRILIYNGAGVAVAFKMAQMCAAVDQFVAVVHPLRHYSIMMNARLWLVAVTWFMWTWQILFGFVAHMLDMETFSEHVASHGGNSTFTGCRWETAVANVYTIVTELEVVTVSFVTAGLLVYTGVIGYRVKARLRREEHQQRQDGLSDDNQNFLANYRAFKHIIVVLSLLTSMDVVVPILRMSSRWRPQLVWNGVLRAAHLFGIILEGWAYGLLNEKLRAAYRKALCGRSRQVATADFVMAQHPSQQNRQEPSAAGVGAALQILSAEGQEATGHF